MWAFLGANAQSGTVTIPRTLYERLHTSEQSQLDLIQGVDPYSARRDIRMIPRDGGIEIQARWVIRTQVPGSFERSWVTEDLVIKELTWNGRNISLQKPTSESGRRAGVSKLAGWVDDTAIVEMKGWISNETLKRQRSARAGSWNDVHHFSLMSALTGTVRMVGGRSDLQLHEPGQERQTLPEVEGRFWTGDAQLRFSLHERTAARKQRPLKGAMDVGMGLSVLEDRLVGQARLRWVFYTGETDVLRFTASNLPNDFTVTGAAVAGWERSGTTVLVRLKEKTRRPVQLTVRWSEALKVKEVTEHP